MAYYQHRISWQGNVSRPLLEQKRILTIGFSRVSRLNFLSKATLVATSGYDLDDDIQKAYGSLLRERHSLWRFLHMRRHDCVLVPGPGTFSVYRVADDHPSLIRQLATADLDGLTSSRSEGLILGPDGLLYVGDSMVDLGFFRRVTPEAEDIGRNDFADRSLTTRMKARQTTLDISDLESSITASLEAWRCSTPPESPFSDHGPDVGTSVETDP